MVRAGRYWRVIEIDGNVAEDTFLDICEGVRSSGRPGEPDTTVETVLPVLELVLQHSDDGSVVLAFNIDRNRTGRTTEPASSERFGVASASVADFLDRIPRNEPDRYRPSVR